MEYRVTCEFEKLDLSQEIVRRHTAQILAKGGSKSSSSIQAHNHYFGRVISGMLMALAVVDEKLKKELKDALELMITHCVINDAICLYHVISKNELPQLIENKLKTVFQGKY